jgi:hypothetical protein
VESTLEERGEKIFLPLFLGINDMLRRNWRQNTSWYMSVIAYLKPGMHDELLSGVYIWRYAIHHLQKRRKANGVHEMSPKATVGVRCRYC